MDDTGFPTTDELAEDFRELAPALKPVTVEKLDPDTGATLATASDVPCLKRVRYRGTATVGDGSVPDEKCRFWLDATKVTFTIKPQDRITDADGLAWDVNSANLKALEALAECDCNRSR